MFLALYMQPSVRCMREIVKILLDKEANPLLKNKDGKTPRDLATNDDVKELLKEVEKKYQEKQAFVRGLAAGGSIAVLSAVIVFLPSSSNIEG